METRDAVIVGARCAGSTLALALRQAGWDVVLVDRDTFPSETVSTHLIFPNTLARMQQLGVLDTLLSAHDVPMLGFRVNGFGHETAGQFTPIDGFDRAPGPRRTLSPGSYWRAASGSTRGGSSAPTVAAPRSRAGSGSRRPVPSAARLPSCSHTGAASPTTATRRWTSGKTQS